MVQVKQKLIGQEIYETIYDKRSLVILPKAFHLDINFTLLNNNQEIGFLCEVNKTCKTKLLHY